MYFAFFNRTGLSDKRTVSTAAFILFSAWMISFPYQGQVLYALAAEREVRLGSWMQAAIGALIIGLLCGIFIRSIKLAKRLMLISGAACLAGSLCFFFVPASLWPFLLLLLSLGEGLWTAAWGWFFRECTPPGARIKTASSCLANSALLMIGINLAATHLSPCLGLFLAVLLLLGSLLLAWRLPSEPAEPESAYCPAAFGSGTGLMGFLCLFILVITINSGLMFSVVTPAFAHLTQLADWYWAVPYIAAILVVPRLPRPIDRGYILFAAISMLGLSFLAFMTMGRSVTAYLVVDTLLLAACGINDLFWWTILGEMLDFYRNPAKILGIGMAANLGGVLLGEILANAAALSDNAHLPSLIGLAVVCVSLLILPPLQKKLARQMKDGRFIILQELRIAEDKLVAVASMEPHASIPVSTETMALEQLQALGLTNRECETALLLLNGYTRQLIASELGIGETTVKTHISNIYNKLEVNNKTELIQKLRSQKEPPAAQP